MPVHTSYTPKLDSGTWDFVLTKGGNLETLSSDEATKQNVCNECRLARWDSYFRFSEGIEWAEEQLGRPLQRVITASRLREAAESVSGVDTVDNVTVDEFNTITRTLKGTISITTDNGVKSVIDI